MLTLLIIIIFIVFYFCFNLNSLEFNINYGLKFPNAEEVDVIFDKSGKDNYYFKKYTFRDDYQDKISQQLKSSNKNEISETLDRIYHNINTEEKNIIKRYLEDINLYDDNIYFYIKEKNNIITLIIFVKSECILYHISV